MIVCGTDRETRKISPTTGVYIGAIRCNIDSCKCSVVGWTMDEVENGGAL